MTDVNNFVKTYTITILLAQFILLCYGKFHKNWTIFPSLITKMKLANLPLAWIQLMNVQALLDLLIDRYHQEILKILFYKAKIINYFYFSNRVKMANSWLQVLLRIPIICVLDYCCSFLYDDLIASIWPWYLALTIQILCECFLW